MFIIIIIIIIIIILLPILFCRLDLNVRWCSRLTSGTRLQACHAEVEREIFYLTTHSAHFIYEYMASDVWLRTILIVRKETRCSHIWLLLSINIKGSFICTIPQTGYHIPRPLLHQSRSTGWNEK